MRAKNILSYFFLLFGLVLSGCGTGVSSNQFGIAEENHTFTDTLLQAPVMDLNSTAPPVFHPLFTEQNYEALLQLNDLSYAVANKFGYSQHQSYPTSETIGPIKKRIKTISGWLKERGWSSSHSIAGRTGRDNVDPDITAIIHTHKSQRLVVVTFHGSRIGDRNPNNHNGKGDWGANYDSEPVAPSSVGLSEMPDSIRIHRGFGNNLASARKDLLNELDLRIAKLGKSAPIWIWMTGHSKGGGMAGLSAGLLKSHLAAKGKQYAHVKVAGILFSSPRAFQGDQSQTWIHDLVGRTNIFRINVHGDPVTVSPSRADTGYRSLGVLFLDSIWAVNLRTRQTYGSDSFGWLNADESANYHYGCGKRGIGFEFDPSVVMRYSDLSGGFEEGRLHLKNR